MFFIEKPCDKHGNTNHPPSVIEGDVSFDGKSIIVTAPSTFEWVSVLSENFVETQGPARELSVEERRKIWAELGLLQST